MVKVFQCTECTEEALGREAIMHRMGCVTGYKAFELYSDRIPDHMVEAQRNTVESLIVEVPQGTTSEDIAEVN